MLRGCFLQWTLEPGVPCAWPLETSLGVSVPRRRMQLLLSLLNLFSGSDGSNVEYVTLRYTHRGHKHTRLLRWPQTRFYLQHHPHYVIRIHIKHRHIDIYRHIDSQVPFFSFSWSGLKVTSAGTRTTLDSQAKWTFPSTSSTSTASLSAWYPYLDPR